MKKNTTQTIGMDIGDKYSHICILDEEGEILEESRIRTTKIQVSRFFSSRACCTVVIEAGTHSPWVSRCISESGHEVLVANARQLALIYSSDEKDDRTDAELLARLARVDAKLLRPIQHRSEQTQQSLAIVRSRDCLVRSRTALINHCRGVAKSLGHRFQSCSGNAFYKLVDTLPEDLHASLLPIIELIKDLTDRIKQYDKQIQNMCNEQYPETSVLRAVSGVGPITALTFVLTLEDPERFTKSRQVGSYLGLCPRRHRSSESDPQLRISKAGNSHLRRLLVGCAQYILGRFGPDCDLKSWGLRIAERGGKNAKHRAVVATARKLAVLLHRLWRTGEVYEPFYKSSADKAA